MTDGIIVYTTTTSSSSSISTVTDSDVIQVSSMTTQEVIDPPL